LNLATSPDHYRLMKTVPHVRRCLAAPLCPLAASLLLMISSSAVAAPEPAVEPLFDLEAIMADPTEAAVLETEEADGVVFQTIEYTSRVVNGAPERIKGIFAFPKDARGRPGVFWSNGGMSAANRVFPGLLAKHGYACLAITLPHAISCAGSRSCRNARRSIPSAWAWRGLRMAGCLPR
jgi:hypothetical protein